MCIHTEADLQFKAPPPLDTLQNFGAPPQECRSLVVFLGVDFVGGAKTGGPPPETFVKLSSLINHYYTYLNMYRMYALQYRDSGHFLWYQNYCNVLTPQINSDLGLGLK